MGETGVEELCPWNLLEREDFGLKYGSSTSSLLASEISLSADEALGWIEQFESFPGLPIDAELGQARCGNERAFQDFLLVDGAIIAAAEALGAETLYTEDLNDGQLYGSVRVENPFRRCSADLLPI